MIYTLNSGMSKRSENLVIKYVTNQLSLSELNQLEKLIEHSENQKLFRATVKLNYAIDYGLRKFDAEKIERNLCKLMERERKTIKLKRRNRFLYYAQVAVFTGFFGVTCFFLETISMSKNKTNTTTVSTIVGPGSDSAMLILEDGSSVLLERGRLIQTGNAKSNGEQIVYDRKKEFKEVVYNYLKVPRAGKFQIILSDGTKVWLNSDSKLKYPVAFVEGETRRVELLYGEAYFDVSSSSEHEGEKFTVFHETHEVEVLGTKFNMKAYKDEENVCTTLVEGRVNVIFDKEKKKLLPSQQLYLDKGTKEFTIKTVKVSNEISWKDGVFVFKGKSLKTITKVLSRWYDVDFVFENKAIGEKKFNGSFSKSLNISDVLSVIKEFGEISDYEIYDKKIFIKGK